MDNTRWYVLQVMQGKEFYVKDKIDNLIKSELKGLYEVLLPTIKEVSEVRRKKFVRNIPVYSSYLFINADLNNINQSTLQNIVYVLKFLGSQKPCCVLDQEMQIVKAIADDNRIKSAFSYQINDMIEILGGHCKGLAGRVIDIENVNTLKVEIQIFNRTISTVIKLEDVKAA